MLGQLHARIKKLDKRLDEREATAPTRTNILTGILGNPQEKSNYQKIANLKFAAKIVKPAARG